MRSFDGRSANGICCAAAFRRRCAYLIDLQGFGNPQIGLPLHDGFACFETRCSAPLLSMTGVFDGVLRTSVILMKPRGGCLEGRIGVFPAFWSTAFALKVDRDRLEMSPL